MRKFIIVVIVSILRGDGLLVGFSLYASGVIVKGPFYEANGLGIFSIRFYNFPYKCNGIVLIFLFNSDIFCSQRLLTTDTFIKLNLSDKDLYKPLINFELLKYKNEQYVNVLYKL